MTEKIHLAVRFGGHPQKILESIYASDEFGEPLKDWAVTGYPDSQSVSGYELSGILEEATYFFILLRNRGADVPYDLLNGRLVRGVTELLSVPGYRLHNPNNEVETRYVDHTQGFTPVQNVGGDTGRLIVVAPLV